ncbi:glutamyl-tRNA reductase [Cryobacterium mesophilum]|uniref:Glutamyl-tRNA reductase n=1 Tax=Terrimesophilobacter mesophilus TaxID=433647 RepID=A0A4R8VBD2_9MICO|nr:glutamyl-tRNA reductase [Terrimesophilobacter mesophilus]MBB5633174.1 glutamyl-tRNA reductase [Terrimesophilobacter mesophilus]TFB79925.1 glutamyl-tRNA reductase [Terrimesophilobacter mesophilus]
MLVCASINHRTAPFDYLERLSAAAPTVLTGLHGRADVDGAIVLSTCNRFEVYLDSALEDVIPVVAEAAGVEAEPLRVHARVFQEHDVPRHLFSVASGLESVVVGEGEIAGQVGRALSAAQHAGSTSSPLERLFQAAAKTSRGVRTGTAISVAGRSLVHLALELAASRFADWSDLNVLLVGTGRYAAATVAALRMRGVTRMTVYSPTGRGPAFATSHGLRAASDLPAEVADADLIVTCTTVDGYALAAQHFGAARRTLVIDLGLPRNVNPDVATVDGIELLDLETVSLHAPLEELNSTSDAHEMVSSAATAFAAEQAVAPAVVALRKHVLDTLAEELGRRPASPETESALRHFAGVLLHGPSVRARELAIDGRSDEFAEALDALFDIRVPSRDDRSVDPAAATGEFR